MEFGRRTVRMHMDAWQFLSSSSRNDLDKDILLREKSPEAAWRSLLQMYSPRTYGTRLKLASKIERINVKASDNPVHQYIEMADYYARVLRSSTSEFDHVSELFLTQQISQLPCH